MFVIATLAIGNEVSPLDMTEEDPTGNDVSLGSGNPAETGGVMGWFG